jgi:hypothetical protein
LLPTTTTTTTTKSEVNQPIFSSSSVRIGSRRVFPLLRLSNILFWLILFFLQIYLDYFIFNLFKIGKKRLNYEKKISNFKNQNDNKYLTKIK